MRGFVRALWPRRYLALYLTLPVWFLFRLSGYHDSKTGLTSLILFGDSYQPRRLERLHPLPIYTFKGSAGYDGQFYSQLAVAGNPFDPELRTALDMPASRSGRILMPLLAHVAGLGRPWWVLNAYALIGIVSWLALAWVLARWWFPPNDLQHLLRWVGCLFGAGMVVSVTRSLTDGPAVLFVALAIRALENKRRWLGTALLAAGGFVRETTLLCASTLLPTDFRERRDWIRTFAQVLAAAVPVILWIAIVSAYHGYTGYAGGTPMFSWPLAPALRKIHLVLVTARRQGFDTWVRIDFFTLVALGAQVGFVLARPRFTSPEWRIGATFAVLGLFLSWAMWDDTPAPVARYLLPLTFAFNRLAPAGRRGLIILALGNLSVLAAPSLIRPPAFENRSLSNDVSFDYGPGWYEPEHLGRRTWCWASRSTTIVLHNRASGTFVVKLEAKLISNTERKITMTARDQTSVFEVKPGTPATVTLGPFVLPPGDTPVAFLTSEPPWIEPGGGKRPLAFSIEDLRGYVAPAPP